ncbi:S-layer homology domain-containing protein [Pseudoflavonifractor sp. AF19-9AC]|uniref:S-layer homology domain-containing protein n=1 Tax=Pseudoflavonifractor sp. AF19-9AC TaxID=2292244 RepID=UPI000E4FBE38|nr:S-layer homology domain-containing protein [Pseudoflavonifractor sp. AF19-9AC]RHR10459.1 S-layer homology domain-containing protein [Pseudoflavonifractor sp. AF19-9AC]
MRNLKRALSLALASVMLLGMMVVGTGAVSYTDQDSVSNKEAVEVLAAAGIMTGDDKGNFNPDQIVTRAEMAVIICNMLYGNKLNVSQFANANVFTDVPTWAQGFVNLAASLGIVAGVGDGKYAPNEPVTTAQATLMLTKALGYFQDAAEFGNDWALAAITRGTQLGLFGDMKLATHEGLTRDNVAQLTFNAITKTTPVKYNESFKVYYTTNWVSGVADIDENEIGDATSADYQATIAYKIFDLTTSADSESFGRPGAYTWCIGNKSVTSVFSADADLAATYTAKMTYGDLYTTLGKTVVDNIRDVDVFVDGRPVVVTNSTHNGFTTGSFNVSNIIRNSKTAFGYDANATTWVADDTTPTGNGVVTEVYVQYDETSQKYDLTFAIINTYVAQAASDYDAKDQDLVITAKTGSYLTTLKSEDVEGLESIKEDDILMVTASWNGSNYVVQTVKAPKLISDQSVTAYTAGKDVTFGGTTYKYNLISESNASASGANTTYDVINNGTYDFYVDDNGYVLYVTDYAGVSNYVYIADRVADGNNVVGNYVTAKAVFTNGTSTNIRIDKVGTADATTGNVTAGTWYTYSLNSDSNYELKALTAASGAGQDDKTVALTGNFSSANAKLDTNGYAIANSSTVFVIYNSTTKTYTVYTGIANLPTVSSATGSATVEKGYATYVYLTATANNISASSDVKTAYVLKTSYAQGYDSSAKKTTYTYDAIVDGQITKLTVTSTLANVGLYYWSATSDGYPSGLVQVNDDIANEYVVQTVNNQAVSYSDGTLVVGGQYYVMKDGVKVFTIDTDGTAEETTLSSVANDGNFTGYITLVDASKTDSSKVAVYFQKAASVAAPSAAVIATQPTASSNPSANTPVTLTVAATPVSGVVFTYQWYKDTDSSGNDGSAVSGATSASYTVPGQTGTTEYYYCVVTAHSAYDFSVTASGTNSNYATITWGA